MGTVHVLTLLALLAVAACAPPGAETETDTEPAPEAAEASGIVPQPIPPGFDFPAERAALQALVDADDVPAMRTHAWNVWAGMTTDSKSQFNGQTLPIWETWLATDQVFLDPPREGAVEVEPRDRPARSFVDPAQFFHVPSQQGEPVSAEDDLVVGFNKYDPSMVTYLWEAHTAPDAPGQEFFYTSNASLTALNATWADGTPLADRKVSEAPNPAIELKPVMLWVRATGLTALPFWQGPAASVAPNCEGVTPASLRQPGPTSCHPEPGTWTHCVVIDPAAETSELVPATAEQFEQADKRQAPKCTAENALYGGLDMLYHFPLDAQEAADFNREQNPQVKAEAGDYAVLAAMHVNTKEIIEWTWQTFWWQGGQSPPDDFPGSLAELTANVEGPWRNYAMCTAYSQTTEPNGQGEMRICFNPFLETSITIPDGIRSNCVSCHGTARIPQNGDHFYPPDYNQPVDFGDPAYFKGDTKTDFSWAMPLKPKDSTSSSSGGTSSDGG